MAAVRPSDATCTESVLEILFDASALRPMSPTQTITVTRPAVFGTFRQPSVAQPRDISEVIAELRSTPEGEQAWQGAQRRKAAALNRALAERRLNKIKYQRLRRGLTQQELARAVGTDQSNISRYERPSYRASRSTLEKLAVALGARVADLL
jgi:ribosome-binding protein aMBF1 (putative translation factor)